MRRILITGAAGFIGFHLAKHLCALGEVVIGIDNLNPYYDVSLKEARLKQLQSFKNFSFIKLDIADRMAMQQLFEKYRFEIVVNLAAQAGVRYSLENPYAYVDANLVGFGNVLENCRRHEVKHLIFASSSSVYGANIDYPFKETDRVDHPVSFYAATKKSNELMAHTYAHLYQLPCTGLRFFTVYGPWGRPDMALFKFTEGILEDKPIDVYNNGNMQRDFTYIDDIINAILLILDRKPEPHLAAVNDNASAAPYRIYNLGHGNPVSLLDFISVLEEVIGKKAIKNMLLMQPGDMPVTYADCSALHDDFGFKPKISVSQGVNAFVDWYLDYYKIKSSVEF